MRPASPHHHTTPDCWGSGVAGCTCFPGACCRALQPPAPAPPHPTTEDVLPQQQRRPGESPPSYMAPTFLFCPPHTTPALLVDSSSSFLQHQRRPGSLQSTDTILHRGAQARDLLAAASASHTCSKHGVTAVGVTGKGRGWEAAGVSVVGPRGTRCGVVAHVGHCSTV
jgi:hypothetical protein